MTGNDRCYLQWPWFLGLYIIGIITSAMSENISQSQSANTQLFNRKIGEPYGIEHELNAPISGEFGKEITDSVNVNKSKTYGFTYEFSPDQRWAIRVCVTSKAELNAPLLVVVRQSLSIISWLIPLTFSDSSFPRYSEVCNTLCPLRNYYNPRPKPGREDVFVDFTTNSDQNEVFSLLVSNISAFVIETNDPITVNITPSSPSIFEYDLPDGVKSVLVRASSTSDSCMVLAIQDIKCPFLDSERTVENKGFYQTLTLQSGITISRKSFKEGKVFILLILKSSDVECTGNQEIDSHELRQKEVILSVMYSVTDKEFYIATFGAVLIFFLVYIFSFIISLFIFVRKRRNSSEKSETQHVNIEAPSIQSYGTVISVSPDVSDDHIARNSVSSSISAIETTRQTSVISLDETDIDVLEDAERDKEVIRTKTVLFVSDLARKKEKYLKERTKIYSWNLLTIAIFYGLPVVQLVYTNQKAVNLTGNQDLCYYNFLCSHKFWVFSDFNHVYSNIGYIMLGLLFLILVWRRETFNFENDVPNGEGNNAAVGIPHHYGMFYAMGWALVMEGVLSASYHVCPNKANFQFDTAFMYIIATVCMLKLYQARHPDITARSHSTWMLMSVVIFIGVIGVLQGGTTFWILFAVVHILTTFVLSTTIYYMGRWKLDCWIFKRMYLTMKHDLISGSFRPIYPGRFIILGIVVILNFAWDIFGLAKRPANFASFLLAIFIMNLLLYLIYYTIMKVRYKERIRWIPLMYIILSFVSWGIALHYFLQKNTSWQMTPALSRERNKLCVILDFYDDHDIWHFISSFALFFSYMVLFTLDDDLEVTPRSTIKVF